MGFLDRFEGRPQSGLARIGSRELQADFCLRGRETFVTVHERSVVRGGTRCAGPLPVRMTDGTHLTFIENVVTRVTSYHGGGGTLTTYMPHFVLLGASEVGADYRISSIDFTIDDAQSVFYDHDAFSIPVQSRELVERVAALQEEETGRPVQLGDHPVLAYFTGRIEILSAPTEWGTLTVRNCPSYGMGGPGGVSIENTIRLRLDLAEPLHLSEAIARLLSLARFLDLIAGRTQKLRDLRVRMPGRPERWFDMLWCLSRGPSGEGEGEAPSPHDVPIGGGLDPAQFSKVLIGWARSEAGRRDARVRFAGSWGQQRSYTIDRLVSAANMFDILPSECFQAPAPLASDLEAARAAAAALFKALPPSNGRDRALGDLGRLGQLNLKSKILQRAARLLAADRGRYAGLDRILRNAVDSRNHYVHGTQITEARAAFFGRMMSFHVDALEYVFATAELLDAGWDYASWSGSSMSLSHPLGAFLVDYRAQAARYIEQLDGLTR